MASMLRKNPANADHLAGRKKLNKKIGAKLYLSKISH
jgi:hypothetical protein